TVLRLTLMRGAIQRGANRERMRHVLETRVVQPEETRIYMQFSKTTAILAASCAVAVTLSSSTAEGQQLTVSVSADGPTLGGEVLDRDEAFAYDISAGSGSVFFSSGGGNLDAFHLLDTGNFLVSTNFNFTTGGTTFDDGDVVEVDAGSLVGTPVISNSIFSSASPDVDAVSVTATGELVFSTRGDVTLVAGGAFQDGDILAFDPLDGSVSLVVPELDIFDDGDGDIDALHILDDGRFAISAEVDELVDGTLFLDGDVFIYDPVDSSAALFLSETVFTGASDPDIDAVFVSVIPEPASLGLLAAAGLGLLRRRAIGGTL
ncbi:MAG: PEP-CTERM sorting domain-containing protein, partial [Planctomycetota bacterium]